jgi:hypothetical protein
MVNKRTHNKLRIMFVILAKPGEMNLTIIRVECARRNTQMNSFFIFPKICVNSKPRKIILQFDVLIDGSVDIPVSECFIVGHRKIWIYSIYLEIYGYIILLHFRIRL